jgi:tetratricopeptide (TPR) repeat protein
MPRPCPSEAELHDFLAGNLAPTVVEELAAHLESCASCQAASARAEQELQASTMLDALRRHSPPSPADPFPERIGEHEILEKVGEGGMGVVYRARHERLRRVVALKVLRDDGWPGARERQRLRTEAEAAARLQHPHIIQIFEVGEYVSATGAPRPYLALEFVEGGNLAAWQSGRPQPPRQVAALVEIVARALQHAHERGVVHRDLKPSNILLTSDGTPKVCDFGVAKLLTEADLRTRTGTLMGTAEYMAPEQALARSDVGPAADIHALGAVLYTLLTGRPPFQGEGSLETLNQVVNQEPVPPSRLQPTVPRDLEVICLKCLEKEPGRRYASAGSLADDLHRFLAGEPIQARPVGRLEWAWRWCRRHPREATLTALAATAVLLALGSWLWLLSERAERAEQKARGLQEQAAQQARLGRDVDEYLQQANRLAGQARTPKGTDMARLAEALGAARQARGLLRGQEVSEELHRRVERLLGELEQEERTARQLLAEAEQDRRMLWALDGIELTTYTGKEPSSSDFSRTAVAYEAAFRDYGIDVARIHPAEAARRIRRRAIRARLVQALTIWTTCRQKLGKNGNPPGAVVWFADPDPWRTRIRGLPPGADSAILKLADEAAGANLPPDTLCMLALCLKAAKATERAAALLLAAYLDNPSDYRVALLLAGIYSEMSPPRHQAAIRFYTAALALRPTPVGYQNLGWHLRETGEIEQAMRSVQRGLALQPDNASMHSLLGRLQLEKGMLDEAVASFREVVRLAPRADSYFNLAQPLIARHDFAGAEAVLRKLLRVDRNHAMGHCNLGFVLMQQGKLAEGLPSYGRGHELGSKQPGWAFPSENWVPNITKLMKMEQDLPTVLSGAVQRPPWQLPRYASLCRIKRLYAAAARLTAAGLAAEPVLATDPERRPRFYGVCAAVQAGTGRGEDAAELSPAERARLRRQALDWLRAELEMWEKELRLNAKGWRTVERTVRMWRYTLYLEPVRGAALEQLPAAERPAWRQLWQDVGALLKRCEQHAG